MANTIAVEKMSQQTPVQVARSQNPVGDWKRQVHVVSHHDALIMVGGVMTPDGVDERTIPDECVLVNVTAIVERFVNEILTNGRAHQDPSRVRIDHPSEQEREGNRKRHEAQQRPPWEKNDAKLPRRVDRHFVVGEILMMLFGMAIVDCAGGETTAPLWV